MKSLTFHPVAEMFPLMQGEEFKDLVEDIRKHGQRHAILVHKGQIIDGRNRYRACVELKRKPLIEQWDGKGSLTELSCSLNFHRRHLTPSQRAATGAIAEEEFAKEADVRRKAGKHLPQNVAGGDARELAAKACGVNWTYISQAKAVRQHDAALFAQLVDGTVTISVASRAVHRARKHAALKIVTPRSALPADSCVIETGDCITLMPAMPRRKARLVFADPPYNIGFDYGDGAKKDRLPVGEFREWCFKWLEQAVELLTPDGSIWVLINHEHVASIFTSLENLGLHFRDWITWYEKFGNNCSDKCNRTSRPLLHFTMSKTSFVFDRSAVNQPSARQTVYGDKRAASRGKNLDDVWDIPRVADNHPERIPGAKTQLPMELLRRVILSATEPGDLVVDPFTGSGTTPAVCMMHGRLFHGIERRKESVKLASDRIARLMEQNKGDSK